MKPDQRNQTERLRELEAENTRLKHAVALLTVDKLLLEEAVEENSRGSARSYPSGR
jgi:cell division protein FtsB